MKLTEHNRSFYMFSVQTFTGTSSLSLNTSAVQDRYPVIPELVVFRKELVVLLYSTLSKILSSRLIINFEVCPVCREKNVVEGRLRMVLGKMVSKVKIGDLAPNNLMCNKVSLLPFILLRNTVLQLPCGCILITCYPLLLILFCFFITSEASRQINQVMFGLSRLCLTHIKLSETASPS